MWCCYLLFLWLLCYTVVVLFLLFLCWCYSVVIAVLLLLLLCWCYVVILLCFLFYFILLCCACGVWLIQHDHILFLKFQVYSPEGRLGMSDVSLLSGISRLTFDSPFLSPLLFFLPSPFARSVLSFFLLMIHYPDFFPENSNIFH